MGPVLTWWCRLGARRDLILAWWVRTFWHNTPEQLASLEQTSKINRGYLEQTRRGYQP